MGGSDKKRAGFSRRVLGIILAVGFIIGFIPIGNVKKVEAAADAYVSVTATAMYDYAYDVLDYVNEERTKYGLNPVYMDEELMRAAMQRAAESCVTGEAYEHSEIDNSIAHSRPDGTTCFTVSYKSMGENIAMGQKTPYKVMYGDGGTTMDHSSWMRSQGHKDNILNEKWKSVGIGVVYFNGRYKYYWSQEFSMYSADTPARKYGTEKMQFTVGVTASVYNRLINNGALNGNTMDESDSNGYNDGTDNSDGGSGTKPVKGEWRTDGIGWWFQVGETYLKNSWLKAQNKWYAFGADGYMLTGWQYLESKYYYFGSDGALAMDEWRGGYYLSGSGAWNYPYYGSWKRDGAGWWYGDSSGWYAVNQWQKIDGRWYYFDSSGYMVTNVYIDGYYLGADGAMQ